MLEQQVGIAQYTPIPRVQGPLGGRLAMVTTEWHRAVSTLSLPTNYCTITLYVDGMAVDEARNKAVEMALAHNPCPEFIFSLDYDVLPPYDAIRKLVYRARCFLDYDIFAGVYCAKTVPPEPLIYKEPGTGPFWDWTVGDLITEGVTAVHMGLTLIRTSLFKRMEHSEDDPWYKTVEKEPVPGNNGSVSFRSNTEDIHFCRAAIEKAGAKILVDTSILAGHINHETGQIFGLLDDSPPVVRCPFLGKKKLPPDKKKATKRCLDIGAGSTRREWDGYKTFTLDIRPEAKPDYLQDTRWLNFPDNHWDMIASSHHLEHLGRWDQERVWSEMFRILKPGGQMEHIVPNIEWAAWKVMDHQTDEHTYNVLYGAQEFSDCRREFNTHFFGYTPQVARELAEQAGLVDVEILDYTQRPELNYNLIITGRKPLEEPAKKPAQTAKKKRAKLNPKKKVGELTYDKLMGYPQSAAKKQAEEAGLLHKVRRSKIAVKP